MWRDCEQKGALSVSDLFKTLAFWFLIIFCVDIHAKSLMTPNSLIGGCVVYTYQEPYQYIVDRSGIPVFQGVYIDILSSVLEQQRMPYFKQVTFNEGVKALKSGECDFM